MSDTDPVILTHNLTRCFGKLKAVDRLNLSISKGKIYGFLGPNGSGKTTTIRMLAGLLVPTSGTVEVLGLDIPKQADRLKDKIGYMTQRFSLYSDLTVMENLEFVAAIHALSRQQAHQRIRQLIDEYYLEGQTHQRADTLSGGQRQRLALAASVLHRPELLFLDEPTSAVDPQSRRDFWEKLFELSDEGTTILVSTHYMDEAERCHELAILEEGALAVQGEPGEMMREIPARVVLVTSPDPRACSDKLKKVEEVIGVTQIGNQLRVQVPKDIQDPQELVSRALEQAELQHEVQEVPADLEDVFVAATTHKRAKGRAA